MKIRLLAAVFLFAFPFMVHSASSRLPKDPTVFSCTPPLHGSLQARILSKDESLEEEKKGFQESFLKTYASFSAEDLFGQESAEQLGGGETAKAAILDKAFQEELATLGTEGIRHIRLETKAGVLIGYFSLENWDACTEKPENFPPHSIYVRQFYVLPSFQRKGMGKFSMSVFLRQLEPNAEHMYIATRRINEGAKRLYETLGFKEHRDSLHELPVEEFISYELYLPKNS